MQYSCSPKWYVAHQIAVFTEIDVFTFVFSVVRSLVGVLHRGCPHLVVVQPCLRHNNNSLPFPHPLRLVSRETRVTSTL